MPSLHFKTLFANKKKNYLFEWKKPKAVNERCGAEPSTVTVERDCAKSSLPTSDDSQAVPFLLTVLLGQPNPNGKKGVSQTAVHFVRLLSRPIRHFFLEKGRELLTEGGSRNEGGGKLPRRTKRTNPLVLIGTIEERKRMVSPFAQGTSSENNVGDRVQEEEEKRNHRPMVLLRKYGTVCDCSYPTPREVLVTAPQVVSEMLLRGEAEAAKEEKLTLFQKKE
ncbi:hypothetical protein L1987_89486 [Smallanthus sonchifolius]|nr:hypothetical protein L1987_89486 [Smallanthus sonchifolius]